MSTVRLSRCPDLPSGHQDPFYLRVILSRPPQWARWLMMPQPFYMFVEPFLPAEIRDKVVFAKNLDELLSYVDEEHLPEDLGGKAKAKG